MQRKFKTLVEHKDGMNLDRPSVTDTCVKEDRVLENANEAHLWQLVRWCLQLDICTGH